MEAATPREMPAVYTWEALRGLTRLGFLDYVGELWRRHGDVFQINILKRRMIVAIHPYAVRQVTVVNRQNYDKLRSYDVVRKFILGNGLLASTGDLWRRQRRLMAPFYTPKGVQAYGEIMLQDGHRFRDRWARLAGSNVHIGEEMTYVTASIILRAMFSMETDEAIISMKNAVETMIGYAGRNQTGMMTPMWIPTGANRAYSKARQAVHAYIQSVIAQRQALPESEWPNDLLSRLMQARDEETGEPMSASLLRDESITTFFAGHETTARTMTYAWYALAKHPNVKDKLHAELDRVLGDRTPTLEDLHLLPYTLQVIKEVLRLYPPAPFYVRDAMEADQLGDMIRRVCRCCYPRTTRTAILTSGSNLSSSTPIAGLRRRKLTCIPMPITHSRRARGFASATTSRCWNLISCSPYWRGSLPQGLPRASSRS